MDETLPSTRHKKMSFPLLSHTALPIGLLPGQHWPPFTAEESEVPKRGRNLSRME